MTGIRTLALAALVLSFGGAAARAQGPKGAQIFAENCSACHQPTGKGIPGAFPALDGDAFVQGPADVVAGTVLKGRGGMPSFSSDLTDEQVAAVLSYVRSAWSNHAAPVSTATVAAARKGSAAETPTVLPGH
ncbi:c-type cytochrome [Sphingomonas bacterium]|uniref:c-type cytochrome n=1 Tax=Sphingomonas bacterium TaxID=1895847 RepID=UPI001576E2B1|nr:cytochrome c [Sphingomonas bacterium]